MKIIEFTTSGSAKNREFFENNLSKIMPIKKVTVFFDFENFLFTKYSPKRGITFVAEGWNGTQIHLSGLNCGYGGTGPTETAKILTQLKINPKFADDLKSNPGLQLEFDKDGNLIRENIKTKVFFSSQYEHKEKCEVFLNDYTYVEYETQKLYFINPQVDCIKDVFNAIDAINPYKLQYFIGKDSPLDSGYSPFIKYNTTDKKMKGLTGVNLILKGKQLELLFLIDETVTHSFINIIHYYLLKRPLFNDTNIVKEPETKFNSFLYYMFFHPDKSNCHGVVKIERKL